MGYDVYADTVVCLVTFCFDLVADYSTHFAAQSRCLPERSGGTQTRTVGECSGNQHVQANRGMKD